MSLAEAAHANTFIDLWSFEKKIDRKKSDFFFDRVWLWGWNAHSNWGFALVCVLVPKFMYSAPISFREWCVFCRLAGAALHRSTRNQAVCLTATGQFQCCYWILNQKVPQLLDTYFQKHIGAGCSCSPKGAIFHRTIVNATDNWLIPESKV